VSEKKEYERAVEEFEKANAKYVEQQEYIESGRGLMDLVGMMQQGHNDLVWLRDQWVVLWNQLRVLLENRNTALKTAQNALRQVVQLAPSQWRGPTGKPTVVTTGEFTATSVTSRWFNAEDLLRRASEMGLAERLLEVEAVNKDGVRYKIVKPTFEIDYEETKKWIKANHLDERNNIDDLLNAYDEKEKTPQVKGPKALGFLGEKKES
jgi:hypothetical protein